MADPCTKFEVSNVIRCGDIAGYLTLTTPLSEKIFLLQGGTSYDKLMYQIRSLLVHPLRSYGGAKCRKCGGLGWSGGTQGHGNATIQ